MDGAIGIIGGSGLYDLDGLTDVREVRYDTPYGPPSDALMHGKLGDANLVFLPRHGKGHKILPGDIPFRANIHALKQAGVSWVISVSAVGSLREAIVPGHAVIVDQYIDRTKARPSTFFGDGVIAHIGFGDPTCTTLNRYLAEACRAVDVEMHETGTYVCMEGPAFSTRAESELYRAWGAHVIGMTALPEAKLAREASMSYATLAFATDYDCWHTGHDAVTVEQVIAVLTANVEKGRKVVADVVGRIAAHEGPAPHHRALQTALLTPIDAIDEAARARLGPILAPYLE
ncbi:MAG: S-methyl-5'-thioadenosine phosphorylase [Myxococcota bacterium]